MLFFIYAVIGMQVFRVYFGVVGLRPLFCVEKLQQSKTSAFPPAGVWEDCHGGRDANQPQQQLPDLPAGRPHALQVPCCVLGFSLLFLLFSLF